VVLIDIFNNLTDINNLTGVATISTMVLGAISLFIANMGRFIQAKKFGIPVRAVHQANISDSADLWVALVGTLGFGIFIPLIMLNLDVSWWLRLIIAFIAFALGILSTKSLLKIQTSKKVKRDGKEYAVTKDFPILLISCIALITTTAYMRLHYIYNLDTITNGRIIGDFFPSLLNIVVIVIQGCYVLCLLLLLILNVFTRMTGSRDIMTTAIDGQNYLITMRHNLDKWILQPCEILDYETYFNKVSSAHNDVKIVLFEKGVFIIKDLSSLTEPIYYHANSGIAEKGHIKQNGSVN